MADYYTAQEVDKLISDAKKEVIEEAKKLVTVTTTSSVPAKAAFNRLWIKILNK